jgi:arginine repressor
MRSNTIQLSEWRTAIDEAYAPKPQPEGTLSRAELVKVLQSAGRKTSQTAVQRFVNILKAEKKVQVIRQGKQFYYRLSTGAPRKSLAGRG